MGGQHVTATAALTCSSTPLVPALQGALFGAFAGKEDAHRGVEGLTVTGAQQHRRDGRRVRHVSVAEQLLLERVQLARGRLPGHGIA